MENQIAEQRFSLELVNQSWLGERDSQYDLCSHGQIRLVIGGHTVSSNEIEYGTNESALALLRTLDLDHCPDSPVAKNLIFHGCGTMLMLGCPIGIDWSVRHLNREVLISQVIRWDTTNEDHTLRFPESDVAVTEDLYRQQIISFAHQVKGFFEQNPRSFYDDFGRNQHEAFWKEFDRLLSHHSK